jgi:hypothetical protein
MTLFFGDAYGGERITLYNLNTAQKVYGDSSFSYYGNMQNNTLLKKVPTGVYMSTIASEGRPAVTRKLTVTK